MASAVTFFSPVDPININTLLGLEGSLMWILQGATPTTGSDFKNMLKQNGDQAAWKSHNSIIKSSATYKCEALTGNLTLPKPGTVYNGYHIDSVKLSYDIGYPELVVAIHKHNNGSTHVSCHVFATDLVFPAQFGIPSQILNTGETSMFLMNSAAVGMKGLSFTLSCSHVDELDGRTGNWLKGENHDGVETLDAAFTGVPDAADLVYDATIWHLPNKDDPASNTAADAESISITRHIARES